MVICHFKAQGREQGAKGEERRGRKSSEHRGRMLGAGSREQLARIPSGRGGARGGLLISGISGKKVSADFADLNPGDSTKKNHRQ